jgi:flagellar FliJ protein
MNSRSNFHRTQQWQLAERQRYLGELEALGERVRADVERLREEIEEAGGADALPSNKRFDPLFIRPLVDRREKLMRSVAEIDAQVVEARAAVEAAQQEVKLIEGALVHRGLKFEDRLTRRARRSI